MDVVLQLSTPVAVGVGGTTSGAEDFVPARLVHPFAVLVTL